jgi:hypothetical protein
MHIEFNKHVSRDFFRRNKWVLGPGGMDES